MISELTNILVLGGFPLLIGAVLRLAVNRSDRPYAVTLCCAAAAVVFWALAAFVPTQGSEWLGLISMEVTYLALGTLIGGAIARLRQRI